MYFAETDLKVVLEAIEEKLTFENEGELSEPSNWSVKVNLKVQDLIDKEPEKANTIKYIVKTLHELGYISFPNGNYSVIDSVTASGYRLLLTKLRNVNL